MIPNFTEGNRLTLLRNGAQYFPALEAAIRGAQREVFLETYIFAGDDSAQRITEALIDAAGRGVQVHVLVDGFGSRDLMPSDLGYRLLAAGVKFLVFRPEVRWFQFRRRRLRRMHRKIVVADGGVGFVGGINVIDDMHTPGHMPPRFDFAVRVEGPLVAQMQEQAERLWSRVAWANMRRRWRVRLRAQPDYTRKGTQRAALLVRDNVRHRADIEDAYLEAIRGARDEIIIANAYFFPGKRFRRALVDAARRGVRVVLLLQGKVEYVLLHYASRALYGMLLDAGVEIHEYHKSFLHAKVAVIDAHWSTVGSSNIDPFSLLLAREANLVALDRGFAAELREALQEALVRGAQVVQKTRWLHQPLPSRIAIWVAYAAARLLMGVFGYAGKH
jgi:cardiolipin synthase A/B